MQYYTPTFIKKNIDAIQRVRELHIESVGKCLYCTQAETGGNQLWIEWHAVDYPCPTIQALNGEQ